MFASVEMQLSGEPLAQSMGRLLTGYSRDFPVPNIYFQPSTGALTIDLVGFSTAVESYEYSKQPLNNLAFESGAGISFLYAPLVNPSGATGSAALQLLISRLTHYAQGANTSPTWFTPNVDGTSPTDRLGWPGFWPTLQPYRSFDPTIQPVNTVTETCSIASDDDPNASGNVLNLDYECDYNSLHLPNRSTQIDPTITPGASGWAFWKYSLWVLNYLQIMHDTAQTGILTVAPGDLANVGQPGNTVLGLTTFNPPPPSPVAGTYLGSSSIEGFQAQVMIDEIENAAQQWLTQLTTADGKTLSGFGSILSALQYNYATPLRWFPGAIGVAETPDPVSSFPQPTGYAISDPGSHLFDQLGLAGAYATIYTLTDNMNSGVGGSQPVQVFFDGDPFPVQNQTANGSATLHDRALAMLRVLVVNIDRLHRDPTSSLLVDDVSFSGATPTRGTTIDTASVAYSIVALRTVRRAITSQLQLYSNTSPDTVVAGTMTALDGPNMPLTGAPSGATLVSDRLDSLINSEAQLLMNQLTTSCGQAFAGWDVQKNAVTSTDDTLDAHSAAIRGLLAAYLATGNPAYRARATAVFNRMDAVFYDLAGRIYTSSPSPQTTVSYTPKRFAMLEGALRDMYELVGNTQAEQGTLGKTLQDRIARLIKLVLNGWDDINGDQIVNCGGSNPCTYPTECITSAPFPDGDGGTRMLGHGGLQMAERALSGELGSVCDSIDPAACVDAGLSPIRQYTPDRESDCVPEISAVGLPSALANQITFTIGQ
jgi:hypothetical protein